MHGANLNVREGKSGYLYTNDLLQLEACRVQRLSRLSASASAIVTPLVSRAWEEALAAHLDKSYYQYITQGIWHGFHIGFDGSTCAARGTECNMQSAMTNPGPVEEYLAEELRNGRITELCPSESTGMAVGRFGVIQKQGQTNKWRLILDLSYPPGSSVNDGISHGSWPVWGHSEAGADQQMETHIGSLISPW